VVMSAELVPLTAIVTNSQHDPVAARLLQYESKASPWR